MTKKKTNIVSTYKANVLDAVSNDGMPLPNNVAGDRATSFPADLTVLPDLRLRKLLGYWGAMLARAEAKRAEYEGLEIALKEARDNRAKIVRLTSDFDKKWESDAFLSKDAKFTKLDGKYQTIKQKQVVAKGRCKAYESYWTALSRELSARIGGAQRDNREAGAELEARFG